MIGDCHKLGWSSRSIPSRQCQCGEGGVCARVIQRAVALLGRDLWKPEDYWESSCDMATREIQKGGVFQLYSSDCGSLESGLRTGHTFLERFLQHYYVPSHDLNGRKQKPRIERKRSFLFQAYERKWIKVLEYRCFVDGGGGASNYITWPAAQQR